MQHALDCKVGGLDRHNDIRYYIGDIAAQVWTQVVGQPIVREAETRVGDSGLRLDLGLCGVGQPQSEARYVLTAVCVLCIFKKYIAII